MLRVIKFGAFFSVIVIAAANLSASVHAAPIPLNIHFLHDRDDIVETKCINMNIPVENATQSAYGDVLRYYDVAIAQAVAITYQNCSNRQDKGVDLILTAGKRAEIMMGKFYISCDLAYDVVSAYGLNNNVLRPVRLEPGRDTSYMPTLNFNTDAKSRQFIKFSSNFKPVDREN